MAQTESGKETSMAFPWLLIQCHDLKLTAKVNHCHKDWWIQWGKCPTGWMFFMLDTKFPKFLLLFNHQLKTILGRIWNVMSFLWSKQSYLISMTFPGLEYKFQIPWLCEPCDITHETIHLSKIGKDTQVMCTNVSYTYQINILLSTPLRAFQG